MSSSDNENCSSFPSIFPNSCRGEAENFAECLHYRLISLTTNTSPSTKRNEERTTNTNEQKDNDHDEDDEQQQCSNWTEREAKDVAVQSQPTSLKKNIFNNVSKQNDKDATDGSFEQKYNSVPIKPKNGENHYVHVDEEENALEAVLNIVQKRSSSLKLSVPESDNYIREVSRQVDTSSDSLPPPPINICNDDIESISPSSSSGESTNSDCSTANELTTNGTYLDVVEEKTPPVRRCSSLKLTKTPPGSPAGKKIVRFADVLGLDLADVKTFLDEVPRVPSSAFDYLNYTEDTSDVSPLVQTMNQQHVPPPVVQYHLMPVFRLPSAADLEMRLWERCVCLESVAIDEPLSVRGTVRVRNLGFAKAVTVRYTLNAWVSFVETRATYMASSSDGSYDRFTFLVYANHGSPAHGLEFAVRFQCDAAGGGEYWDNNAGSNYRFRYEARGAGPMYVMPAAFLTAHPSPHREDFNNSIMY